MGTKLYYSVEGDIEFEFDHSKMPPGFTRSWTPAGHLIDMPRVHKDWGTQNGGNWEAADVGLITAKIDEKIDRRVPMTGTNVPGPLIVLDAEWSIPQSVAGITKLAKIVEHLKRKRPTCRVFMYGFAQGSDVTDGVAASVYIGKPTMMVGAEQYYWSPADLRKHIEDSTKMWRGDKSRVMMIHRRYDQGGPSYGRLISDYELGVLLEVATREGADVLTWDAVRKADKPMGDPATRQPMIDPETKRPMTLAQATAVKYEAETSQIVAFHQSIKDLVHGAYRS